MMPFYSLRRRKTNPPDAGQGEVCRGFALRGANCEFSTSSRLLGGCVYYYLSPCVICDHISRRFLLRDVNAAIAIDGTKFPPLVISKDPDDPNKTIITMLSVCIQCLLRSWISPLLNISFNTVTTFVTQRL